jgi:integrase
MSSTASYEIAVALWRCAGKFLPTLKPCSHSPRGGAWSLKTSLVARGFHMLRHAAASLFIKYLGWSPKRLQAVMGCASINMTFDRYGHLFESVEADREAIAKIEAAVRTA